jgi:hypothetical protein
MQKAAATITERTAFADRPPILDALRTLGLRDSDIARALGLPASNVADWRNGRRPIPHKTQAALLFVAARLLGIIGASAPPMTLYARRASVAIETATLWTNLARDEFAAELGTDDPARDYRALVNKGHELGKRALARLEKADAA